MKFHEAIPHGPKSYDHVFLTNRPRTNSLTDHGQVSQNDHGLMDSAIMVHRFSASRSFWTVQI